MIYIGGHMKNYILYERYHNYRHRLDFMHTYDPYPKECQIIPGGWTSSWDNDDGSTDSNWNDGTYNNSDKYYRYRSESNLGKDDSVSKLTIKIKNITTFNITIMSNAETNFDYVVALTPDVDKSSIDDLVPDQPWTAGTTYSDSSQSITYTIPDDHEWHTIVVVYRKDGTVSSGTDRGYLLIDKS